MKHSAAAALIVVNDTAGPACCDALCSVMPSSANRKPQELCQLQLVKMTLVISNDFPKHLVDSQARTSTITVSKTAV